MAESNSVVLADEANTIARARQLAAAILAVHPASLVIHLQGDLGAGKTTFARGLLAGLGHRDRVPSPTYTLVEPYELSGYRVLHLDLYRLRDPGELADLGLADEWRGRYIALIEWPEQGLGHLPVPDLVVHLAVAGKGRQLLLSPRSATGRAVLDSSRAAPSKA
ncbi:MAG: tRNA (adenosine(37)-N6)-threonylcarbamoyltransferase complex ATPase subunit type 1 TsaE [Gammaproteobacteria bacterium]|nr:tRNA (adenosine(37)-N6)-threonylcarbamoyltransferase complex ATPase subunit type 1 TsaE [Gammaproteobacteria bacterium]